jgi:Ca2+-binding EF-hand superfamily protein
MSVFHPRCSKMVKLCHAFAIYDFDNDGYLGLEDLKRVVKRLTHRGDGSESIITQVGVILEPKDYFGDRKTLEQLPSG